MKKLIFLSTLVLGIFLSFTLSAQTPVGIWKTIDDESGEPKSHVEIYEKEGKLFGKVVKLLPKATTDVCLNCPGDLDGKSLLEMDVFWDLKPYKDYWSYGKIIDPAKGKVYKLSLWVEDEKTLKLRGYIGVSVLGRNQTWHRVE